MVNRGVGARDKVTDAQLAVLVAFLKTGITAERVKTKSLAVSYFVRYLHAIHELQEHLLTYVPEVRLENGIDRIDNEYAAMQGRTQNQAAANSDLQ